MNSFSIENFKPYNNEELLPNQVVLVWSKSSGYFFAIVKEVKEDQKIIAIEL